MRAVLIALASVFLLVAVAVTARTEAPAGEAWPSWIPRALGGFELERAAVEDVPVGRDSAIDVVRRAVFLADAPAPEPRTYPLLVSGHVARDPITASPTGQVVVPLVEDVPAWLVVWRGLEGGTLERFGDWPDDALVDAVFLVDGQTGDCCWVTRFLTGRARLS